MGKMLEGIRVIDLTTIVFGPYATLTLADLGAEVIKIEGPGGDVFRQSGKPARTRYMGPQHHALNRGKKSVVLDLKDAADAETMRALLATADVFIHNIRAKAIAALGFDYDEVRAIKPDIIYVHCTGFGSDGPYAPLQAYDDVIQAVTGATTLASRADGNPAPRYLPTLIADKVAGLHGAQAVLAALVHRLRTGEGQHVEVPMFEAFNHFNLIEHLGAQTFDPPLGEPGYPRQLDPNRQPFATADGHIALVTDTDASYLTMFDLIGAPELAEDPRFATRIDRFRNQSALFGEIAGRMGGRTTAEWCRLLAEARIPAMPVVDLARVIDDPHLTATGAVMRREHPSEGGFIELRPPVRYGARSAEIGFAPLLDEHGPEIRGR